MGYGTLGFRLEISQSTPDKFYIKKGNWFAFEVTPIASCPQEIKTSAKEEIFKNQMRPGIAISEEELQKILSCLSENHPLYKEVSETVQAILDSYAF